MQNSDGLQDVSIGAVPGKRTGLRACLILLAGAGLLCAPQLRAQAAGDQPAPAAAPAPADKSLPPGYVGSETCATCHEEVAKKFADNPHTKMALMHGSRGVTCENCHGAGKAHVEGGGDVTKIFNPAKATPKEVDAKCQGCHAGTHPNFDRSPHAKANVSCLGCHSVHAAGVQEHLLKAEQPTLCFQCHNDVKPAFAMPFHHKVNEGLVTVQRLPRRARHLRQQQHQVHGRSERDLHQVPHRDARAVCLRACGGQGRGLPGLPHAARIAECAAAEYAEYQHICATSATARSRRARCTG